MRVLLSGNIPDPSILEDGGAYYLVYSTLRYFPGMLLYRSDDLRHWERVCTIVQGGLKDIWAPDLVKHKGRYYIYFAADGKNWVVWSDRIDGGYSDPIDLQADGWIDPGHAVDRETGRRYLFFNNGYAAPLSDDGLRLTAPPERVADAWPIPADWDVEGVYMESPKILDKNGYYYLTVAQGGTAGPPTSHMAISLRSRQLLSGWEFSPYNPVIHCRGADEKWWSTGHATIFDDKNGDTYALYHGYPRDASRGGRHCCPRWNGPRTAGTGSSVRRQRMRILHRRLFKRIFPPPHFHCGGVSSTVRIRRCGDICPGRGNGCCPPGEAAWERPMSWRSKLPAEIMR